MISNHRYLIAITTLLISLAAPVKADPVWSSLPVLRPTGIAKDTAGVLFTCSAGSISRSSDHGETWAVVEDSSLFQDGFAMTVNPVTNDLFVAVEAGVFRTHDEGETWTKLTNDIVGTYAIAARIDGLIIAGGSPGVWKSTDNGDNWTKANETLGPLHDAITFSREGTIFTGSILDGLFRSTDDGVTWQNFSSVFGDTSNVQDVVADTTNGYVYVTAYHQFFNEPTYNKVFRSSDDGLTWELVDSTGGIGLGIGIDALGNVFTGRHPTAYSTDHGNTWTEFTGGIDSGDRLVDFLDTDDGNMLIADMDDSLKVSNVIQSFLCGDADGSGIISIGDAVFLISFIFGGGAAPDPIGAGDADSSGGISIADAVFLVTFIFGGGPAPCS